MLPSGFMTPVRKSWDGFQTESGPIWARPDRTGPAGRTGWGFSPGRSLWRRRRRLQSRKTRSRGGTAPPPGATPDPPGNKKIITVTKNQPVAALTVKRWTLEPPGIICDVPEVRRPEPEAYGKTGRICGCHGGAMALPWRYQGNDLQPGGHSRWKPGQCWVSDLIRSGKPQQDFMFGSEYQLILRVWRNPDGSDRLLLRSASDV